MPDFDYASGIALRILQGARSEIVDSCIDWRPRIALINNAIDHVIGLYPTHASFGVIRMHVTNAQIWRNALPRGSSE